MFNNLTGRIVRIAAQGLMTESFLVLYEASAAVVSYFVGSPFSALLSLSIACIPKPATRLKSGRGRAEGVAEAESRCHCLLNPVPKP